MKGIRNEIDVIAASGLDNDANLSVHEFFDTFRQFARIHPECKDMYMKALAFGGAHPGIYCSNDCYIGLGQYTPVELYNIMTHEISAQKKET